MMKYTIWRVNAIGESFQIGTSGIISDKKRALEKASFFTERLLSSDPGSGDRFVVRNDRGQEFASDTKFG